MAAAVLRIHADRAMTAKREIRLLSRFTGANPHVAIVGVPSLPFDVSDLEALRAIADQITGEAEAAAIAAMRLNGAAVFALGGEELRPGNHLGMLLEQGAALAFGHSAPDAELDAVVQRVGAAFEDHRAVPADHGGFALGGAAHEQFVGIGLPAAGLGNPRDAGLGLGALDKAVTGGVALSCARRAVYLTPAIPSFQPPSRRRSSPPV